MEFNWKFKFSIGDKVRDPLGNIGLVTECCVNPSRSSFYYVRTGTDGGWWVEDMLELVEEEQASKA